MSSVIISGDSSGSVTLTVPSAAGTNTATLPAKTGTVMVSGNMPAFSAYASTNQSIPNGTATKIAFDTLLFDTNSNYNTSTYRFTPTVAGYYQFNSAIFAATSTARPILGLNKNGSPIYQQAQVSTSTDGGGNISLAFMAYANGSTDYFEMYYQQSTGGSITINSNQILTMFQGYLIRAA